MRRPDVETATRYGMYALGAANLGIGIGDLLTGRYVDSVDVLVFGVLFIVWPVFVARMRAQWLQRGFMRGRLSLYDSIVEAQKRGMSPQEWFSAEVERDFGSKP